MNSIIELENEIEIKECPYCKSNHFIKYGKFNGIQRYKCKNHNCLRTFSNRTESPWRYSKKGMEHWHKYMRLMDLNSNLRQCADKVNISLSTSFYWRHKILKAIHKINEAIRLDGNVEIIKTMFNENNKGVRGSQRTHKGKISIMSALDSNNNSFSQVIGNVPCNQRDVEKVIKNKISDDAHIDAYLDRGFLAAARKHNKANKERNTIAKSNNIITYYMKQLNWIHRFRGISTKYINRYLTWFSVGFNYKN